MLCTGVAKDINSTADNVTASEVKVEKKSPKVVDPSTASRAKQPVKSKAIRKSTISES
jgi:hypothetical protein